MDRTKVLLKSSILVTEVQQVRDQGLISNRIIACVHKAIKKTMKEPIHPAGFTNLFVAVFLMLTVSCASVRDGSPDYRRKALSFAPPANKSSVYVCRPTRFAASGARFRVFLDFKEFGELANNCFLFAEVEPGMHSMKFEASAWLGKPYEFKTEPGKLYFFRVSPWHARPETMDEKEGFAAVRQFKLSGENAFEFEELRKAEKR